MTLLNDNKKSVAHYSRICTDACGGACCDPWWGIISYPLVKADGGANLPAWRKVLLNSIKEREERIRRAYVTREAKPKALFGAPERYNVTIQKISVEGKALVVTLLAMFSFRCRYLGINKECTIHPSLSEDFSRDIRPDQCGFLGVPGIGPGQKGYCSIIYEAGTESGNNNALKVDTAIKKEREVSQNHQKHGVTTAVEATDKVMAEVSEYVKLHPGLTEHNSTDRNGKVGRNDPCLCGSGKKYKKCCG